MNLLKDELSRERKGTSKSAKIRASFRRMFTLATTKDGKFVKDSKGATYHVEGSGTYVRTNKARNKNKRLQGFQKNLPKIGEKGRPLSGYSPLF